MADVFISYKSEDRARTQEIADALVEEGFDVWWDTALIGGQPFGTAIHEKLIRAKAVVVLWSQQSVTSEWVNGEAAFALEEKKLVPAFIEQCGLAPPFNRLHTRDLTAWRGNRGDQVWRSFVSDLQHRIATPASAGTAASPRRGVGRSRPRGMGAIPIVLGLAVLAIAGAGIFMMLGGGISFRPAAVETAAPVVEESEPPPAAQPAPARALEEPETPAQSSAPSARPAPVEAAAPRVRREPGVYRDGNLTLRAERVLVTRTQQSPAFQVNGQIRLIVENTGDEPIEIMAASPLRVLALTLDTGVVLDGASVHASELGIAACSRTPDVCHDTYPDRFARVGPHDELPLSLRLESARLVRPGLARLEEVRTGDFAGRLHVIEGGRGRTVQFGIDGLSIEQ